MHFALGGNDFYIIVEAPDLESAASVAMTVNSTGAAVATTTVLLTADEVDRAAQMSPGYTPPRV